MLTLQVTMFLDKNRATMRPDLIELMCGSKSEVHSSIHHNLLHAQMYIGRTDRQQMCSRIKNNDCRPLSTVYKTVLYAVGKGLRGRAYLLTISSPDIDKVAMSLYDITDVHVACRAICIKAVNLYTHMDAFMNIYLCMYVVHVVNDSASRCPTYVPCVAPALVHCWSVGWRPEAA